MTKKGKGDASKAKEEHAHNGEPFYPVIRQVCEPTLVNSLVTAEAAIETVLDGVIQIAKDKEIALKVPEFACKHTMQTFALTFEMKSMVKDDRIDEIYIMHDFDDADHEPESCGKDSICTDKLLNKEQVVNKRIAHNEAINVDQLRMSKLNLNIRKMSPSDMSGKMSIEMAQPSQTSGGAPVSPSKIQRRPSRLTDSEKRRRKEKKLLEYYQTLVVPVQPWGPFPDKEYMQDGTDVDLMIKKKRAHKTLLAEAF